jgi:hypothetical protein
LSDTFLVDSSSVDEGCQPLQGAWPTLPSRLAAIGHDSDPHGIIPATVNTICNATGVNYRQVDEVRKIFGKVKHDNDQ